MIKSDSVSDMKPHQLQINLRVCRSCSPPLVVALGAPHYLKLRSRALARPPWLRLDERVWGAIKIRKWGIVALCADREATAAVKAGKAAKRLRPINHCKPRMVSERNVTMAACYLSPEGLVLGADSTSTYANSNGHHYFNHGQKLFEVGQNSSLGIVTWGLGGLAVSSYRMLTSLRSC
jgi:hypothetical protein